MFIVKTDLSAGSYTDERDLGALEQRSLAVVVDADELSGGSFHARGYVRETEADTWQELNGSGSNEVNTRATFSLEGTFRYVKVVATVTGSDFPSGVTGY